MLEDLKNFYAGMFSYRGEATAREVYNPLIVSVATGIFFAIANSFVQGYVAKWLVVFATAIWGIATVLALWAIGVRRVTWMRRSVVPLVLAALCAVPGVGLWFYGVGVPRLLGGVLRPLAGYSGVALLAFGAVVWLAWVLPSRRGMARKMEHRKPSNQAKSKTPRHVVAKQDDKGRHVEGGAPNETPSQQRTPQGIQAAIQQGLQGNAYDGSGSSHSGLLTL
jgi:uncharacterized membrane protein YhaH (DUF805 family)